MRVMWSLPRFLVRGLPRGRAVRGLVLLVLALVSVPGLLGESALAQSTKPKTKTLSVFKGRAVVKVPKTTKALTKLYSNLYLGQSEDSTKKFALYISKDKLWSDEVKMTNKKLGESIKLRLQGEGYTILSFKTQGLTHTANIEGFTQVPWQAVGTAPVRGVAKFTRTADKQLIGALLLCDPPAWSSPDVEPYKSSVLKAKVATK